MNPSVNRFSESPRASFSKQPKSTTNLSTNPDRPQASNSETSAVRQQPIPPPNHPKQYRAIGLIQGKYQISADKLHQGLLLTEDGREISAVLLGRSIAVVKKHLDLDKNHLWVVYPRIREENDNLQVQIVGVWQGSTPSQTQPPSAEGWSTIKDGYFSIRGEVVYYRQETETVIIKIKQFPKKESEKIKLFKLKLKGTLPGKPVHHFWDLQVNLQGETLVIQDGTDMGRVFVNRKPRFNKGKKNYPCKRPVRKVSSGSRPKLKKKH